MISTLLNAKISEALIKIDLLEAQFNIFICQVVPPSDMYSYVCDDWILARFTCQNNKQMPI